MRILAHSKNKMLKIGEDDSHYTWFFLDEKISNLYNLDNGIEVEIEAEERSGQKYLIDIKGIGGITLIAETPKISREDLIVRQSVLKAIGASMPALTGQVDPNNIWDIMIVGYERLLKKVTE